jgi:hypothetical protein
VGRTLKPEYVKLDAKATYRLWRCRCSHCELRVTLRCHPDRLRKPVPCPRCYGRLLELDREIRATRDNLAKLARLKFERKLIQKRRRWRIDWNRQLRRDKGRASLCRCSAWEWHARGNGPHRAGSCVDGKGRRPDVDRAA